MDTDIIMRVLNNIYTLLHNRGHNIEFINKRLPKKYIIDKIEKFRLDKSALDIFIEGTEKKVFVKFLSDIKAKSIAEKIKKLANITEIIHDAYRMNNSKDEVIIVILDEFDKELYDIEYDYPNLTIFEYKKLLINIVENVYVPKHTRLTHVEKKQLKNKLMIQNYEDLPLISKLDAVCRYYNYKEGDVIRVERPSAGTKTHTAYRYVVRIY